jgi:alpha-glucosidase
MAKRKAAAGREWWRGATIYQIYPRSYQDTTGDGSGDLAGITRRLKHVADLGADAIWISPFFKSPMADMGYDVSDYCDVDPMFGTLADFDALVAEAHRLGLKVIIDQVLSHSSDQHPWFKESRASRRNPKADWYVWADPKPDGSAPNNWISIFGGPAWEWDSVRRQYYLHNFLASQPDLNFHNLEVQKALLETVRFWLERGVDGFRLDTVNFYFHDRRLRSNPPLNRDMAEFTNANPYEYQYHQWDKSQPENIGFLKKLRALLDSYGDRATVGEVGDGSRSLKIVADYTSGGDKLNMCYTFDLLGPQFSPKHFARCIEEFEFAVADGWICWAFSNHDVTRHVSRWTPPGADPGRVAKLAAALIVSLRGSICIYQGEELGLLEADIAYEDLQDPYGIRFWPGFKGRDGCRTPMPWDAGRKNAGFSKARKTWLPVPAGHAEAAVSVQRRDPNSVMTAYRAMLAFRRALPPLVEGSVEVLEAGEAVLALARRSGSDTVLCVFNLATKPARWTAPRDLGELAVLEAIDLGASLRARTVSLPPLSAVFLSAG